MGLNPPSLFAFHRPERIHPDLVIAGLVGEGGEKLEIGTASTAASAANVEQLEIRGGLIRGLTPLSGGIDPSDPYSLVIVPKA